MKLRRLYISVSLSILVFTTAAQTPLDTAPDFSGKDIHGVIHHLYSILDNNQHVLLDFFTTSCGPCSDYAPEIQQAYTDWGSNQGQIFFLGINYGDDNPGVEWFDSLYGITFPTISGLNGHGNTIALQTFDVQSFPTLVLVAPDRSILNQQIYPPSYQMIDSVLSATFTATGINDRMKHPSGPSVLGTWPNPAGNTLHLRVSSDHPRNADLQVFSFSGSLMFEKKDVHVGRGVQSVDLPVERLQSGMYFVKLFSGNLPAAVVKFIKK